MLYLQKYLTNFQKLFFGRTMRKVAIVVENFNCTEILVCNSNATNFPTSWICKNYYFSLYTVPAEMLYLQKYLTNFQKRFFGWKMRKVVIVVENFKCTDILVLQYNGTNFPTSRKCKNFNFSFTLSQQKCYIFKSI